MKKLLPVPLALVCLGGQSPHEAYTAKIREYTTEPFVLTALVDHLPASERVPTTAALRPGEKPPIPDDVRETIRAVFPLTEMRCVIFRFAGEKNRLVAGTLAAVWLEQTRREFFFQRHAELRPVGSLPGEGGGDGAG